MNVYLSNYVIFSPFELTSHPRLKPIIYVISALVTGILLYQCYQYLNGESIFNRFWRVANDVDIEDSDDFIDIQSLNQTVEITFQDLIENSDEFALHTPFPTQDNLIKNFAITQQLRDEVVEHAKNVRPVMSSRVWSFIPKILNYKKDFGSCVEQELYEKMTPTQFVNRMLQKRPLMFCGAADSYLLREGVSGVGGFENIGTEEEEELELKEYQSYFEMSLAAFISLFVPTHFINDGSRHNLGVASPLGTYEPQGIYVGMVGARFEKPGLMEWAHMVITPDQNTAENGYGRDASLTNSKTIELRLWAELYQSQLGKHYAFPDYEEACLDDTGRYLLIQKNTYLDTYVYRERMKLIIESFLLEANERAKQQGKQAYLHVVGLGLGVWMLHSSQTDIAIDIYAELFRTHKLDHISDVDFSWFKGSQTCGGVSDQQIFDNCGHPIKIHFSHRNPADKLLDEDEGKLLIAQYAWDANAYPGNEYWSGMLTASGDPAAACCSTIPELQNPEINPHIRAESLIITEKIKSTSFFEKIKAWKLL